MNRIVILLALPYALGLALFFLPSSIFFATYGEQNFAYMNSAYLALIIVALISTIAPFYLLKGHAPERLPAFEKESNSAAPERGPVKAYTLFFALIVLLILGSARDLAGFRIAAVKYAFLADILELLVITSLAKRPALRKADLLGIIYVALLNILTLRRYALIPFLLITVYLVRNKVKLTRIAKNSVLVVLSFLLIQFVREAGSEGLSVMTLSSAYFVLPWNRLAMLIDGITFQPFSGTFFYSFTSFYIPPGLPAGSLIWNDALGVPTKDILGQDLEYKTVELLKGGYLPINWFTLLGDLYADMGGWLWLYILSLSGLAALSKRLERHGSAIKVLAAYLFTALMLVGTYNILMFPRFVWMLIAAFCLALIPKIRIF